ncbi:hypothetical protein SERLADRAFT_459861, partial [Serpula lacrymans var. lacrymans S7.9]
TGFDYRFALLCPYNYRSLALFLTGGDSLTRHCQYFPELHIQCNHVLLLRIIQHLRRCTINAELRRTSTGNHFLTGNTYHNTTVTGR